MTVDSVYHTNLTKFKTDMDNRQKEQLTNRAEVSEKAVEAYLVAEAKKRGLLCLKYSNSNRVGFPDRILLLPGSRVAWVELKSKGKRPSPIQTVRFRELRDQRHQVYVADSRETVDIIFATLGL